MTLNKQFVVTISIAVGLTNVGCSDGDVGIGSDNPAEVTTGLAAYAGTWDGYVEAFKFENGDSDRVRLVLDDEGQGTIRFGDRDLLAKPTDPNALYYPPQAQAFGGEFAYPMPFEGFEYPVRESTLEAARIRTGASSYEIRRDFCAIHATYPYRKTADQEFSSPWTVDYSATPVTFAGIDHVDGICSIVLYETAPTTVEELTTVPLHHFSCDDVTNNLDAYNLAHPDHPFKIASEMPSACEADGNGRFRLWADVADRRDIQIDAALEDSGKLLNGSLMLPAGPNGPESVVRNLRLTRVQ